MDIKTIGRQGLRSSAIGLGCMGMSDFYGGGDDAESIATIQAALDQGITLLDTGDFYGMGHNELLIGKAIKGRRDQALLSVKFGALRNHDGAFLGYDCRPAAVRNALTHSLTRLGVDCIDFYFPARKDPSVPIEDTVGTLGDLVQEGKIRYVGLSEVSAATIRKAHATHPISALEIEYSLWDRDIELEVLPTLRELGIGLLAYGALSRGLLSGSIRSGADLASRDSRHHLPRFTGENLSTNLRLVDALQALAQTKGCTASQLAIAWVMAQGEDIVTLVGTKQQNRLAENLGACALELSATDLARIEAVIPRGAVAGTRYPEAHMAHLNG